MSNFNVGLIGFGYIGQIHLQNLLKFPNINLGAIFSKIEDINQLPNEITVYNDYIKMVSEVNLNAVIIATPTYTHSEIACYCAEKGIDIFLEKPMANTLED